MVVINNWGKKSIDLIYKQGFNPTLKEFLIFSEKFLPNCTITDTIRTTEEQMECYKKGSSKCDGIIKKSNHQFGNAFDIVPYPSMWSASAEEWIKLYASIQVALYEFNKNEENSLELSWGGFWNKSKNEIGWDCPHYEIKEEL